MPSVRKGKRGGQNKLSVADQLLITLQYWREYRTKLHIALDFGISEATVCQIIQRTESFHCLKSKGRADSPND